MRNSIQKSLIYEIVNASSDHPSAETIYHRARMQMPAISLGTVYRNLSLLAQAGLVKHIPVAGGHDRYDKTIVSHSHFKCRTCGEVTDIMDDGVHAVESYVERITGHKVENCGMLFEGVCVNCRKGSTVKQ